MEIDDQKSHKSNRMCVNFPPSIRAELLRTYGISDIDNKCWWWEIMVSKNKIEQLPQSSRE